ncbi:hypothetical protein BDW68DRAFT_57503 [Aspergillus falconensis]
MLDGYGDSVWGRRIHSRTRSGADTGLIPLSSPSMRKSRSLSKPNALMEMIRARCQASSSKSKLGNGSRTGSDVLSLKILPEIALSPNSRKIKHSSTLSMFVLTKAV